MFGEFGILAAVLLTDAGFLVGGGGIGRFLTGRLGVLGLLGFAVGVALGVAGVAFGVGLALRGVAAVGLLFLAFAGLTARFLVGGDLFLVGALGFHLHLLHQVGEGVAHLLHQGRVLFGGLGGRLVVALGIPGVLDARGAIGIAGGGGFALFAAFFAFVAAGFGAFGVLAFALPSGGIGGEFGLAEGFLVGEFGLFNAGAFGFGQEEGFRLGEIGVGAVAFAGGFGVRGAGEGIKADLGEGRTEVEGLEESVADGESGDGEDGESEDGDGGAGAAEGEEGGGVETADGFGGAGFELAKELGVGGPGRGVCGEMVGGGEGVLVVEDDIDAAGGLVGVGEVAVRTEVAEGGGGEGECGKPGPVKDSGAGEEEQEESGETGGGAPGGMFKGMLEEQAAACLSDEIEEGAGFGHGVLLFIMDVPEEKEEAGAKLMGEGRVGYSVSFLL